ncbi:hypothetical protein EB796_024465 [Bugula neritina]|uniref:Uncharacterized protein n=1 Tax=Bugula neritina TaxID=10212 RepID=A0A7J7IUY5_BUGNE|nr:hypothetical protein EB796_024465 [Bugula neritina]
MQLIKGDSTGMLLRYMEFNDVPTYVYLGLLSGLPADQIQKVEFIEGLCFDYDILDFDRCKFYSDCCAMTSPRPMEQLAKGTFSCHDGFYIVDHCPAGTNSTLKDLCERFTPNDSDLSLERWPVRGVLNELSYKNIYCAMCNGILPQSSFYLQNVWWNIGEGFRQHINDTVNKVEWWPAQVHCDAESATDYIENFPTHSKLMELIESSCQVLYQPPNSPDLCFDAIRECPSSAGSEIATLCEQGIANYIQVLSTNHIYRNQFCALCHGVSVDDIIHPSVQANTETSLLLYWKGKKLRRFDSKTISLNDAIVITRPILFNMPNATFSFTDFNSLGADFTCSFFADSYFNFCQERILLLANNLTRSQTQKSLQV